MVTGDRWWDSFSVGDRYRTESITVTETHVVTWAGLTGDWVPLHVDAEYAAASEFGERIAHGPLTLALALGLATRSGIFGDCVLAWLGLDDMRLPLPVRFGDTIHADVARTRMPADVEAGPRARRARLHRAQPARGDGDDVRQHVSAQDGRRNDGRRARLTVAGSIHTSAELDDELAAPHRDRSPRWFREVAPAGGRQGPAARPRPAAPAARRRRRTSRTGCSPGPTTACPATPWSRSSARSTGAPRASSPTTTR